MNIKKFLSNNHVLHIILGIIVVFIMILTYLFINMLKIHNTFIFNLIFISIVSTINLIITFFIKRQFVIYIIYMTLGMALSAFLRPILWVEQYNYGKLMFGIISLTMFLIVWFFEKYFSIPKNERSFVVAYRDFVCSLLSKGKNKS